MIPRCKKSHSIINAKNVPKIRNGPNGISLLIVNLLENKNNEVLWVNFFNKALKERRIRPTPPPIQKASTIAYIPEDNPKRKPMPSASLTSPKPIHAPFETSQSRKNGRAMIKPPKIRNPKSEIRNKFKFSKSKIPNRKM